MSERFIVKLEDIVLKIGDGLHGTPEYDNNGEYYFINGNNLVDGKVLIKNDTKKINYDEFEKIKKDLNEKTILVSINGTLGKVAKYNGEPCALGKSACYINLNTEIVNRDYFYYVASNVDFQDYLNGIATGTTIPNVPLKGIRLYSFDLPPFPEQQAIASVLSALDDKIDLLQRQNQTLEQMAATLFRQWFIEEAKEDWEDGCLGDIATNIRINADTQSIQDNEIYIGLEHIERRNIALSNHGYGSDVASNKSRFMKTDVLFGKLRPYFHKVCMAPFDGVCSTDILVLRAKQPAFKSFILFAFFQDDVVAFANLTSGGTRMPRADWKTLSEYPIAIPPMEKVLEFEALANPSISKIFDNLKQIQTLQTLRDTLLPKLISGEVRLKGFETLSEA